MVDRVTPEQRSWIMSRVSAKDTKPEIAVRSMLHRMGFRFRLHDPRLAGRPDIVLRRHRTAIFVHGCFWHRHRGCKKATTPETRRDFWIRKFEKNIERDRKNYDQLEVQGWRVLVIWQCELEDPVSLEDRVSRFMESGNAASDYGQQAKHR